MANSKSTLPRFPYGAVYFRKSNPPSGDWDRDYRTAAEDGMNIFRHWFLWSAIEVRPGTFDWDDYDAQLRLAADRGMKTIIAEMTVAAPEWAYRRFPHARIEKANGKILRGSMGGSSATGGFQGMCLDNDDFRETAGKWISALAGRYRGHAGLGGYDVWNECNIAPGTCYCEGTQARFRAWLRKRYGDVATLGKTWQRHSFSEWDDVTPPRELGPYPDTLDWLQFRIDNAYELMQWRIDLIRAVDPDAAVVAHGIAASLSRMAPGCADDWLAASKVQIYGCTWGSSRHGDEPWKQLHAMDLVRGASRGKPFWHAEAYAGPLWMQPQVIGKPRDEGRIASPEDIRYWDCVSFMCGARGLMYLRYRPLLDGPLFGAFGPYGMDGSRTERSRAVAEIAAWVAAPRQERLWQSSPVKGDVGIIYAPETQLFLYAQMQSTEYYSKSVQGAYQAFLACNIQADWVHIDDIDGYDFLYLPIPVMLKEETVARLKRWVEAGGTLVAEGCPAYFGDRGHVGTVQPNFGLDELFGARESYVEFTPDLLDDLPLSVEGFAARGGVFLQAYQPTGGEACGYYEDGRVAAVRNQFGGGRTILVGTMIGYGFGHAADHALSPLFRRFLEFAGKTAAVRSDTPRVIARLHDGAGGRYLWVANPSRRPVSATLGIDERFGPLSRIEVLRGGTASAGSEGGTTKGRKGSTPSPAERQVRVTVGARDVGVYELE